jgi:hypothetical protein
MKTYVLTVSKFFPKSHSRSGHLTNFPKKILDGSKRHTIRTNYPFWAKRFEQIAAGTARLSVRIWTGLPYRSSQYEIASFTHADGIHLQKLSISESQVFLNDRPVPLDLALVARNDGLTWEDFKEWFKDIEYGQDLAIINFSSKGYFSLLQTDPPSSIRIILQ